MSLLIKNVQIIDGTNRPPVKADILVKKERIVAIGNLAKFDARETIDGRNAYAVPGFIDINNRSDRYGSLFNEPLQDHFLSQGVTTIIGGQCGISLAPLLYGSLEAIEPWVREGSIAINWHTMAEYLKALEGMPRGVNVGTLVGQTSVKYDLTKNWGRDFSGRERSIWSTILKKSLEEGAWGCSIEFPATFPARNISNQELHMIGTHVAHAGGMVAIHMNTDRAMGPLIQKAITISKETGAKVVISHLVPTKGNEREYEDALARISKESAGADVYFDYASYPSREIPLVSLLAVWQEGNRDREAITKMIWHPEKKQEIIESLPTISPEKMVITRAPEWEHLEGITLAQFAENRGLKNYHDALLILLAETRCRVVATVPQYHPKLQDILRHDRSVIASNDTDHGEWYAPRPRVFADILKRSQEKRMAPLHTVIYKMTGLPAKIVGLQERGVLQHGNYADIAIVRNGAIEEVIVNGARAVQEGNVQKKFAGKIMKRES